MSETSHVSINMEEPQHNGDHARTPFQRLNILEWINSPKKYSKGMNIEIHLKNVKRFIDQLGAHSYAAAILTNSLEEECQLELFSNPAFDEMEDSFEVISNLLRKLFRKPQTEISNMVSLFAEKQDSGETITDFLLRLRVKAYKLMGFCDKKEKEVCVLNAFINGLKDRSIAKAVELIKPEDTESALFIAKREENKQAQNQESSCFNITTRGEEQQVSMELIKEMSQQIKLLSQQVAYLTNLVKTSNVREDNTRRNQEIQQRVQTYPRRTYAEAIKSRPMLQKDETRPASYQASQNKKLLQCWNCSKSGHSWRNCWKQLICVRCSSTGHVSRFCRQREALRYFEVDEEAEEIKSVNDEVSIVTEESNDADDCLTMQQTKREKRPRRNTETAVNKPLVMGKCENKVTPILIDSGAALNVIDESFVKEFGDSIRIKPESLTIRCANNGKVASLGKVVMKIKIGSHEEFMKFSVIPNLFPRVIIGLRQMKRSDIVVDPRHDSIWIRNQQVQFISKTIPVKAENL